MPRKRTEPHVIRVDVYYSDGTIEEVDGVDLDRLIRDWASRLPDAVADHVASQVADLVRDALGRRR